jgi:CBS domain-containing protein
MDFVDARPASAIVNDLVLRGDQRLAAVMRPLLWCAADDPIREVARRIGERAGSYALVRLGDPPGERLGIVTDHDFRHRVATGAVGVDAPVSQLATSPVLAMDCDAAPAAALVRMLEHGVHHLLVTDRAGRPVGVVRVVDLAQAEVRGPVLVRASIDGAETLDALAAASATIATTVVELRADGVPARQVGAVHAVLVEAVLRRVLQLRTEPTLAEVRHSWILLGSLARREPLPLSDVDTALMWADPPPGSTDPADAVRAAASRVLDDLRRCGLSPCPKGANADNPLFGRSQSDWATAARSWMHDPTREGALLLSAMVADSRPLTDAALGAHLTDSIRSHTRTSQFLRALLDEALGWRPPTGAVRPFVVDHRGEHRGHLDLKRGGLAPVVALGRWIAIATGDASGTTPERLDRGVAAGLLTADERDTLTGGFDGVYTLLFDHEARAVRAGAEPSTFISPAALNSLTRRHLRETFRAIRHVQVRADQDWIRRLTRDH